MVLKRKLSAASWSETTRQYAWSVPLLEDELGAPLGSGMVPEPCLMTKLQCLLLRQMTCVSDDNTEFADYERISEFVVAKIVAGITIRLSGDYFREELNKDDFLASMPGKSRTFMLELWAGYEAAVRRDDISGRFQRNKQFCKEEDSYKQDGCTKPRGITVMCTRAYVMLYRMALVAGLIYTDPVLGRWLIKYKTGEELYDSLLEVVSQSHRSQDISGFEAALGPSMRAVLENSLIEKVFRLLGDEGAAKYFRHFHGASRHIATRDFSANLTIRCSGDFLTALGNLLVNVVIILLGHWKRYRSNYASLEHWWLDGSRLRFLAEGDDAIIPMDVWSDVAKGLRMKYSMAYVSNGPGGADFLKRVWLPMRDATGAPFGLLNVLRALKSLTHVKNVGTRNNKRMFLLRAKALSLHYLSPGHPIVWAIVQRIGKITAGSRAYRGVERDLSKLAKFAGPVLIGRDVEKRFPDVRPTLQMRAALSNSTCAEIPPVSFEEQVIMEQRLSEWDGSRPVQLVYALTRYPEYESMVRSSGDDRPAWCHLGDTNDFGRALLRVMFS